MVNICLKPVSTVGFTKQAVLNWGNGNDLNLVMTRYSKYRNIGLQHERGAGIKCSMNMFLYIHLMTLWILEGLERWIVDAQRQLKAFKGKCLNVSPHDLEPWRCMNFQFCVLWHSLFRTFILWNVHSYAHVLHCNSIRCKSKNSPEKAALILASLAVRVF